MRRGTRSQKNKKKEVNSDVDEDMSDSVTAENDETESGSGMETSSSTKKRSKRQAKISEEDESSKEENGPTTRRRKKDDSIDESDNESDKPVNKKKRGKSDNENDKSQSENGKVEGNGKAAPKSKKKTVKKKDKSDEEQEYEVEKIVDQRTIKGRRQFLIRWKGYSAESDTWEHEKELNCNRLIEEFLAEQEENEKSAEVEEKNKKSNKKSSKGKKDLKTNDVKDDEEAEDSDDSTEYEVEKIIDVRFKKDKKRLFLIRWKGFSSKDDSWEPEELLNCPKLIDNFMEKLEKIKNQESRELRINRSPTNRYTLTMYSDKRQSRRNVNKERKRYYDCD